MTTTNELFGGLAFTCKRIVVGVAIGLLAQSMPSAVSAQNLSITFDNSFGAVSLPTDFGQNENYQILESYGLKNASNLFHSFSEFGVPTGGSATFEIGADVLNVISRVTGGSPSEIDGLISIDDNVGDGANFWMINPAGMMFGSNSVINVGGTFNVGAADYLFFSESGDLSYSLSDDSVNLLVANPVDFGFVNLAPGDGALSLEGVNLTFENNYYAGISLAGRNVSIINGIIESFSDTFVSGDIRIRGERTITLVDADFYSLTVNESRGGDVTLSSDSIFLENSSVRLGTFGQGDSGQLAIHASDTVSLVGTQLFAETAGAGSAGLISILGDRILLNSFADGVQIDGAGKNLVSSTSGFAVTDGSAVSFGAAGTVLLDGNSIAIANTGFEVTTSSDRVENAAAQLKITANSGDLRLRNTGIETSTLGASKAGNVFLTAEELFIADDSVINSETYGAGNAGFISIQGGAIRINSSIDGMPLEDVGSVQIASRSRAGFIDGPAVDIGSAGAVSLTGNSIVLANTVIEATTISDRTLALGEINLNANGGNLTLLGTTLGTSTFGASNAGNVFLTSGELLIADGTMITSETVAAGNAGFIDLTAESIIVEGSVILARTFASGNAGNIGITADDIALRDSTLITTETFGAGNAGSIQIRGGTIRSNVSSDGAPLAGVQDVSIVSNSGSDITDGSEAGFGASGDVLLAGESIVLAITDIKSSTRSDRLENEAGQILILGISDGLSVEEILEAFESGNIVEGNSSKVTLIDTELDTDTFGMRDAGNILLAGGELILSNETEITASTEGLGNAGFVGVSGGTLLFSGASGILSEATAAGTAGNIDIRIVGAIQIVGSRSEASGVTSNAEQSQGGNIFISTNGRLSLDAGIIRASAGADGNGGDVIIVADTLLLQESSILARAQDGNGGKLDLLIAGEDQIFITDSFSILNADSDNGTAGEITINAPDVDLDSALQEQVANFVAPPQLAADTCGPTAASSLSTFTLNDEGGTPVSPDRYLSANAEIDVSSLLANATDYNYAMPGILIASAQIESSEGCR